MPVTEGGQAMARVIGTVVLGLTIFGLVMVLSATSVTSLYKLDASPLYQFSRQALWGIIGLVAFFVGSRLDHRRLQPLAGPLMVVAIALLVAVLFIGQNINGSSRWLAIGPVVIQPSELAKFAVVVFCADLLARRAKQMHRSDLTIKPIMIVFVVVAFLLLRQPKLGTVLVLAAVVFTMLFVAGARMGHLALLSLIGMAGAAFFAFSADYRRARITAFLDPWADPTGVGLQTVQSQIGIASGGWLGVGLGGSRSKWGFLPHAHSDFIFSVVAEEVGLIGAGALILAFFVIGYFGMRTAMHAPDQFGVLLAAGLTSWILIQAFLNIAMAMGSMPSTGETLPFVSAGGSSLVTTLFAAGVLASIARRARV